MKTRTINLDDYEPHPKNPNTHPDGQLTELGKSIERFGQFKNVVVWQGYYLAGHGFVEAARRKGIKNLVAVDMSHLSEADAMALLVADNRLPELSIMDEVELGELIHGLPDDLIIPGVDGVYLDDLSELLELGLSLYYALKTWAP